MRSLIDGLTKRPRGRALSAAAVLALGLAGLAAAQAAQPGSTITHGLILDGVTVVDTHTGAIARDRAVVMDGDKIVRIVRAHSVRARGGAKLVDARGKFVVPGYLDMHVHPFDSNDILGDFKLMLANGITGIRVMSGSDAFLAQRQRGALMPVTNAPELLSMPGDFLTRLNTPNAAAAVAQVRKQKAEGADFIKVVDTTPETLFAVLAEAKAEGITVDGHLPQTVDVREAVAKGMHGIEHLGPGVSVLMGCSTGEAALRQTIAAAAVAPPAANNAGDPGARGDGQAAMLMRRVVDTYDEAKCLALAHTFIDAGTWQIPTLIRLRTIELADDPVYVNDPNVRHIKPDKRQAWANVARQFTARTSATARQTAMDFYALQQRVTKLYENAGVKMMVGTDSGGMAPWCVAGFALGQEFDSLADAGLTPLQILQMTTLNGAEFLGRTKTMGAVEVGKDANLVVLDANPIASAANLKKIDAVVRGGAYLPKGALQQLADSVVYP